VKKVRLCDLKRGEIGVIASFSPTTKNKQRLSDLGFIVGRKVVCMFGSPLGDPTAYLVRGTLIALRREHSEKILVEVI